MKEGDIYFWRWKDDKRHGDCAPFRSYHCWSQKAIVLNGRLLDTYWNASGEKSLDPDTVILTYKGNEGTMAKIREDEFHYYKFEDIVDMRHPNALRAPIYVKPGAQRDPDTMREYLEYELRKAQGQIRSTERHIELLNDALSRVENGNYDLVHL